MLAQTTEARLADTAYHFHYLQYAWYGLDVVHPWADGTRPRACRGGMSLVRGRHVGHGVFLCGELSTHTEIDYVLR